jgi:hypothetical protein
VRIYLFTLIKCGDSDEYDNSIPAHAYIIAVHSEDPFLDDPDIELALFDGAPFQGKLPLERTSENVFFIANKKLTNTSVSAVPYGSKITCISGYTCPNDAMASP